MNQNWKSACVAAALLAITGAASAAGHDKTHGKAHSTPPTSSNKQSLEDAARGQVRADERQSDSAEMHSNAPGKKGMHTPEHGMDHRNMDHSMDSQGKGWKNPAE